MKITVNRFKDIGILIGIQIILAIVFSVSVIKNNTDINNWTILLLVFLVALSYLAIYHIYKGIKEHAKLEAENEIIKKQQKIQAEHLLALKSQINDIDKIKAEINNNNIYKNINNKKEMSEYINQLMDKYIHYRTDFCDNKIVDAIIFNKVALFKEHGIDYFIQATVSEELTVKEVDLISVLNNLLDNAIEGCLLVEPDRRFIGVEIDVKVNYLIIKVSNSKFANVTVAVNNPSSKNKNCSEHGLGLRIIERICRKYEGNLIIKNNNDKVEITVFLKVDT